MDGELAGDDGWVLQSSTTADIDALMDWFPKKEDVEIWGGPTFRYPFTRAGFYKDIYWGRMESYSLFDPQGSFAAFGQLYLRKGRVHLARLVAEPTMRGRGVGKRLIKMLMAVGRALYESNEYSLFVFRDNVPALECYKSLGFVIGDYPEDMPHADVCYFLTRPYELEET
jgi:ribosomal protein S18 acetylase RimI-like enzyme